MLEAKTSPAINNLRKIIWEYCRSKVVVVGIGNILKGDDGAGPILISRLKNKIEAICIDAATVPENYIGLITKEKPDLILLADAISNPDTEPGEIMLYSPKQISRLSGVSTHSASLSLFLNLLSQDCLAKVYLIGINPSSLDFDTTLSVSAQQAISRLEELFLEVLSRN